MKSTTAKRATSKDVAKLAGVSQSTVSRAYNLDGNMSKELREKVYKASKELGYRPNRLARSLTKNNTGMVAIVTYTMDSPFISKAINLLVMGLQQENLQSLVFVANDVENVDTVTDRLLQYHVDLVVILGAKMHTRMVQLCEEQHTPVVLFNRSIPFSNTSAVCCNDNQCGQLVAQILYESGCRSFAFVSAQEGSSTNAERKMGFISKLNEYGITSCSVVPGGMTYKDGLRAGEEISNAEPKIDACFCANDGIAIGVLDYLKNVAKLRVPEDISIVGFDNIDMTDFISYKLSTVHQPLDQMVDATIETVLSILNKDDYKPILKIVEGRYIKRNTTK